MSSEWGYGTVRNLLVALGFWYARPRSELVLPVYVKLKLVGARMDLDDLVADRLVADDMRDNAGKRGRRECGTSASFFSKSLCFVCLLNNKISDRQ